MSKAILVLDKMPENCMECPLRFKDGDTDDWFRFRCHMSTDQIPKEGKLNNCELKHFWEGLAKYQDFIKIEPTPFNIVFKDRSYKTVQIHDITPLDDINDVLGFVGSFSWNGNKLTPLDGDSYYSEMLVYGYKETDGILDILVKDW